MAVERTRAERAFDRNLAKGRYPDGSPCREGDRNSFVRAWNDTHRKLAAIKRAAQERRQKAIDRARAESETVHED